MSAVIPSINCPPKMTGCVLDRIAAARKFSDWVHLDIADGIFTFNKSWQEWKKWPAAAKLKVEVHLMVEDPGKYIDIWKFVPGVERFIVHAEVLTPGRFQILADKARAVGKSVMLALNPETKPQILAPYLHHTLQFQILAVYPGLSGQKFLMRVLRKAFWIRDRVPNAIIEVDGGITPKTARLCRIAGADILVSSSYIFESPNPAKAYRELLPSS